MNDSPHTSDTAEDEIHLLDYLIVLAKHSRIIIYTTLAVTVLTFLVLFISPKEYTATARLLPPQQNLTMSGQLMDMVGGGVKPGNIGGAGLIGLLGLKSPADIYVGMLTGDTIADQIIEKFNLKELYKKKTMVDTRKSLSKRANIIARKEGLIVIEVTDKSAERAAKMANTFITELSSLLQNLGVQEARGRLAILEKELGSTTINLTNAEESIRAFGEKSGVVQIDIQTKNVLSYIGQLRAEIDAKEVQVQVLRQQATPYNYDVIRLETQVKGLKDKLQAAEKQWDQSCVGDVCLPAMKTPNLMIEYMRLYRQVKYQEALYQLYTKMVEIARFDLVKDVAVIQVVDKALPPDQKSKPKRFTLAVVTGVATAFFLIIIAFLMEYWKSNMESKEFYDRWQLVKHYAHLWKSEAYKVNSWFNRER